MILYCCGHSIEQILEGPRDGATAAITEKLSVTKPKDFASS